MGKLDEFFRKTLSGEESKSELEILDEIEGYLSSGDIQSAIDAVGLLETEHNRFLAMRMILMEMIRRVEENPDEDRKEFLTYLGKLINAMNAVTDPEHRALLSADTAVVFYYLGDELSGDMALKTALNLASGRDDVLSDIVRNLTRRGLLDKAGYVLTRVKDRERLDSALVSVAEILYRTGDVEKARLIIKHISNPFHRAMALYYIALIEANRDREAAAEIVEAAMKLAEKVKEPDARFELMLKLEGLRDVLEGNSISLSDILARKGHPQA